MALRTIGTMWAVIGIVSLLCGSVSAITTKIDAGKELCIRQNIGKDIPLSFSFWVSAGGLLDIDATIKDGSGRVIQQWKTVSKGEYQARGDATNTRFEFCFSNTMARYTPKWVSFSLIEGLHPSAASAEHLDPIERKSIDVSTLVDGLMVGQKEIRRIEHDHRNTVEDTNDRVLLWSVIETVALIFMGLVQVFFMKRFLEVRSTL